MTDEAAEPRTPGAGPEGGPAPSANIPPWLTAAQAAFARQQLVRPREGRYIAGVCGALARRTNTDPVLWRVLLAVLGVLGGAGVLFYLIGWLVIPSEGDTASPVEGLLGKGRSGMSPLSVVLLGAAALLTFSFVVSDGARASMLAAAVLVGAFLLIKRGSPAGTFPPPPAPPGPAPAWPSEEPTAAFAQQSTATAAPAAEPVTAYEPPRWTPPPADSGYRPPFAPHGPFAGSASYPPPAPPPPPVKPPKPPKERSILGRLTFFAIIVVMGVLAALDMAGLNVAVSAYFAAALATIGLGLLIGTWFGRARGLIFLAFVTAAGLLVSTGTEQWGGEFRDSVYRPATLAEVADSYEFTLGNVTLDLRSVDFTGVEQSTTVTMKVGQLQVLLPDNVDTTTQVRVGGRAEVFGQEYTGSAAESQEITDLGADGAGGGKLALDLRLDTGNLEVIR
ncbi:PspC family transcriptional regulator [Actinoplanes cyaneus]|uniref:PspC family transcriptional regulator n=1 Tax=Actinoplanes cyaneus TaxID=52696 RepID=A0A919MAJ0_9ACTN|nr:PspC domain-containing protein [Actinoplanes cyaneus]MCW2136732.1 phage shock protein C (PspC) family protein [Actinoplanes cyaneus]GID64116.1 PspC family transcriptional regulator [Actinoplanes cyaneus]